MAFSPVRPSSANRLQPWCACSYRASLVKLERQLAERQQWYDDAIEAWNNEINHRRTLEMRLIALEREAREHKDEADKYHQKLCFEIEHTKELRRERAEDRAAIREVNTMTWDAWREKHAATIARAERP